MEISRFRAHTRLKSCLSLSKGGLNMSRTVSGLCVVGGLLGALIGIAGAGAVGNMNSTPDMDGLMMAWQLGLGLLAVVSIVVFFVGALKFSRGK
jgi:hypothetical protein